MDVTRDLIQQHEEFTRWGGFVGLHNSHHASVTLRELQHRRKRRQSNRTLRLLSSFWQPPTEPIRRMSGVHRVRSAQTVGLEALHRG